MSMRLMLVFIGLALCVPAMGQDRRVRVGLEMGYADEHRLVSSAAPSSGVHLAIANVQFISTLLNRPGRPQRTIELVNEVNFMQSVHPGSRFIFGASEVFRWNFPVSPRWRLFFDTGAGITSSALRVHEINGPMQYLLQAGGGLKKCQQETTVCWLTQYRLVHLSNNNTTIPNFGMNLHAGFVGLSF